MGTDTMNRACPVDHLLCDDDLTKEFDRFAASLGEAVEEARSQGNEAYVLGELLGGLVQYVERLTDKVDSIYTALEPAKDPRCTCS